MINGIVFYIPESPYVKININFIIVSPDSHGIVIYPFYFLNDSYSKYNSSTSYDYDYYNFSNVSYIYFPGTIISL